MANSIVIYNVSLTIDIPSSQLPNAPQIMTLNALSNGYYSTPTVGYYCNPPLVVPSIKFENCTGIVIFQAGGYPNFLYGNIVTYNLPDGSLLTFGYSVTGENQVVTLSPSVPTTSAGSLYAVSYDPDYQTGLNLTLTLVN